MLEFGRKEIKTFVEDYYNRNNYGKSIVFDTCDIIYSFRDVNEEVITTKASLFCVLSSSEYKKFEKSKKDFIVKGVVEEGELESKINRMFYSLGLTSIYVLSKGEIEDIVIDYGYSNPSVKLFLENGEFNFKVQAESNLLEEVKLVKQNM